LVRIGFGPSRALEFRNEERLQELKEKEAENAQDYFILKGNEEKKGTFETESKQRATRLQLQEEVLSKIRAENPPTVVNVF
jgi:hypothetical protein